MNHPSTDGMDACTEYRIYRRICIRSAPCGTAMTIAHELAFTQSPPSWSRELTLRGFVGRIKCTAARRSGLILMIGCRFSSSPAAELCHLRMSARMRVGSNLRWCDSARMPAPIHVRAASGFSRASQWHSCQPRASLWTHDVLSQRLTLGGLETQVRKHAGRSKS